MAILAALVKFRAWRQSAIWGSKKKDKTSSCLKEVIINCSRKEGGHSFPVFLMTYSFLPAEHQQLELKQTRQRVLAYLQISDLKDDEWFFCACLGTVDFTASKQDNPTPFQFPFKTFSFHTMATSSHPLPKQQGREEPSPCLDSYIVLGYLCTGLSQRSLGKIWKSANSGKNQKHISKGRTHVDETTDIATVYERGTPNFTVSSLGLCLRRAVMPSNAVCR